eukprot:symbB.v1.2.028214.t2/scaffold2925.1/size97224/4
MVRALFGSICPRNMEQHEVFLISERHVLVFVSFRSFRDGARHNGNQGCHADFGDRGEDLQDAVRSSPDLHYFTLVEELKSDNCYAVCYAVSSEWCNDMNDGQMMNEDESTAAEDLLLTVGATLATTARSVAGAVPLPRECTKLEVRLRSSRQGLLAALGRRVSDRSELAAEVLSLSAGHALMALLADAGRCLALERAISMLPDLTERETTRSRTAGPLK